MTEPSRSEGKDERAFEKWRRSAAWVTGIGLTPEQEKEKEGGLLEAQRKRCERWKGDLMKSSPAVTFMLQQLALSKCPITPSHVVCAPCGATRSGGFSPVGGVLMCQDGFSGKSHMEDTLVHELLHVYDQCRFKVDWSDLRHHACSEIRAANLSGDCRWTREMKRGFFGFSKQHQSCVRRRAILSVRSNPNCPDEEAASRAVNEVWESCFADTRPFDEIY